MSGPQQYCLRWNNHRSNLLTVFDQLLQNEAFTDVTLACEGGTSVKCHKMVLAACSSYFQALFTELPCRHPVVVLKDVRYGEMKAILEYMYRGEVNVAHDQLAALLKVAEALKVKGLVEENGTVPRLKSSEEEGNAISTSSSTANSANPPSSSVNEGSPPHSSTGRTDYSRFPYSKNKGDYSKFSYEKSEERSRVSFPMWGVSGLPLSTPPPPNSPYSSAALNRCYEAITADMPPLRRKKLSSLLMSRDTPILRTVLGQGQADSSQPVPLVCRPDSNEHPNCSPSQFTNGSAQESGKKESTSEDAPSPFTDISATEEDERQYKFALHSSSPQPLYGDNKDGVLSGIANYVPTPKPEWKRYKQYTRNDIMSAIEAVRNGMTALQASRLYKVPSRTLYDKVKKLGITTSRPFRRSSNGNGSAAFPYGLSGTGSMVYGSSKEESNYSSVVMEHGFLHHTLEAHNIKREEIEREAAVAMVAASNLADNSSTDLSRPMILHNTMEAHSIKREEINREVALNMVAGSNSSEHFSTDVASPNTNERSPSPNLIKYARARSASPSSPTDVEDESDRVEDLSISRKCDTPTGPRVIMPPISSSLPQPSAPLISSASSVSTEMQESAD